MTITETYNILLAVLMAIAAGLVGSFALMRKMSLAADAMGHIALPGLGIALLYSVNPIIGGAFALFIGVLFIWKIEKLSGINTDAVIGVLFTFSLALGALTNTSEEIIDLLFGGFTALSFNEFIAGIAISLIVIVFIVAKRRALTLSLVSKDLARAAGINIDKLNLYYLFMFALTIILGLRYLGVLLMGSLVIIPAATARNFARNLSGMLIYSALFAVIAILLGIMIEQYLQSELLGPMIIMVASGIFVLGLFISWTFGKSGA